MTKKVKIEVDVDNSTVWVSSPKEVKVSKVNGVVSIVLPGKGEVSYV